MKQCICFILFHLTNFNYLSRNICGNYKFIDLLKKGSGTSYKTNKHFYSNISNITTIIEPEKKKYQPNVVIGNR